MNVCLPNTLDTIEQVPDLGYQASLRCEEVADLGEFPNRYECGALTKVTVQSCEDEKHRISLEMTMVSHAYHGNLARFLYGDGELTAEEELGLQAVAIGGRVMSLAVLYALERPPFAQQDIQSWVDVFMGGDCQNDEGWALARAVITEMGVFAAGQKRDDSELVYVTLSLNQNDSERRPFLASEFVDMIPLEDTRQEQG